MTKKTGKYYKPIQMVFSVWAATTVIGSTLATDTRVGVIGALRDWLTDIVRKCVLIVAASAVCICR